MLNLLRAKCRSTQRGDLLRGVAESVPIGFPQSIFTRWPLHKKTIERVLIHNHMHGRRVARARQGVAPQCLGHNSRVPRLRLMSRSHHGRVGQIKKAPRLSAPRGKRAAFNVNEGIRQRARMFNKYVRGGFGHYLAIESGIAFVCKSPCAFSMATRSVSRYKHKRTSGLSRPLPKVRRMSL